MKSNIGLYLSGAYILLALYLILTQGLFGESFIALILGLPWSFLFAFFEFWHSEGLVLSILLIVPMIINAFILYKIGNYFSALTSNKLDQ